jgi:hypothetical protein
VKRQSEHSSWLRDRVLEGVGATLGTLLLLGSALGWKRSTVREVEAEIVPVPDREDEVVAEAMVTPRETPRPHVPRVAPTSEPVVSAVPDAVPDEPERYKPADEDRAEEPTPAPIAPPAPDAAETIAPAPEPLVAADPIPEEPAEPELAEDEHTQEPAHARIPPPAPTAVETITAAPEPPVAADPVVEEPAAPEPAEEQRAEEPAQAPNPPSAAPSVSTEEWSCEIALWSEPDYAVFYARSFHDGDEIRIAESPRFPVARNATAEPTKVALMAHKSLCDELARAGWTRVGPGAEWYGDRFRRDFSVAALTSSLKTQLLYTRRP